MTIIYNKTNINNKKNNKNHKSGGGGGISRGGGAHFQKSFEKFVEFFRSTELVF